MTDHDEEEHDATNGHTPHGGRSLPGDRRDAMLQTGTAGFMVETRERLTSVEQKQDHLHKKLDTIEETVEEVAETAHAIDDRSVEKEVIAEDIAPAVEKNTRVRRIARWLGLALVGLSSGGASLVAAGWLPL